MSTEITGWKKCSTCKRMIAFGAKYYVCSVSSCNGQRTGYVFCSVQCFDAHIPGARHRDAGAVEQLAPKSVEGVRRIVTSPVEAKPASASTPREVLVIASRLKDYIHERSGAGYNTSTSVMDLLSDFLRFASDRAIENARTEGRKTVMDRDFEFLKKTKI